MPIFKFLALILSFTSVLLLSSCLGELPPSDNAQEIESYEKLRKVYSAIEGVYEGVLTDSPQGELDIPVQLKIFMSDEPVGRNEDGVTRFVPVLQAYYRRLDIDDVRRNYFVRSVRYYEESGRLLMATEEDMQSGVPGVGYLSIQGRLLQNGNFEGNLSDHRGPQGKLLLQKLASSIEDL